MATASPSAAVTFADPAFDDQEIVSGLDLPVGVAFTPADVQAAALKDRMYIVEKGGRLKVAAPGSRPPSSCST